MNKIKLFFTLCLSVFVSGMSYSQNIGIGTTTPGQKLHIHDSLAPNQATIRISGLSSTSTIPAGVAPFKTVMVDANGVLVRGGTSGAGNSDSWSTAGNAGTTPANNFFGTTDAQDLVIKTAGSAASNERMRVTGSGVTAGQIVGNNTIPFPGDVFSIYSNNTTNGLANSINNSIGNFAVNGYASGNGSGVYGATNGGATTTGSGILAEIFGTNTTASGSSQGVYGLNYTDPAGTGATAGNAIGVRGDASGDPGTAVTIGVLGNNSATAGEAYGVYGLTSSPSGMGVVGVNSDVSANPSHGVQGESSANGAGAGIRGYNFSSAVGNSQSAYGVRGSSTIAPTGTGFVVGIRGDASGASGTTYGAYGLSVSATGYGMGATNTNTSGTGIVIIGNNAAQASLVVGSGAGISGSRVGTYSIATNTTNGTGLIAVGNNQTTAIFAPTTGCGVSASGSQYGVMGFATTTVSTSSASTAFTNGANGSSGGYFEVQNAGTAQTYTYVGVRDNTATLRKIIGPGTVNTIVKDLQGNRVALSCPEAPENLFQDLGEGQLVNGHAHITLDPILSKNIVVDAQHPMKVFIQPEGNCQGVYVTNKTQFGFDVDELNGGQSNIKFSYFISANRADEINPDGSISRYSAERFPAAPGPMQTETQEMLPENTAVKSVPSDSPRGALRNVTVPVKSLKTTAGQN